MNLAVSSTTRVLHHIHHAGGLFYQEPYGILRLFFIFAATKDPEGVGGGLDGGQAALP